MTRVRPGTKSKAGEMQGNSRSGIGIWIPALGHRRGAERAQQLRSERDNGARRDFTARPLPSLGKGTEREGEEGTEKQTPTFRLVQDPYSWGT